eukprot:gene12613-biopygen7764
MSCSRRSGCGTYGNIASRHLLNINPTHCYFLWDLNAPSSAPLPPRSLPTGPPAAPLPPAARDPSHPPRLRGDAPPPKRGAAPPVAVRGVARRRVGDPDLAAGIAAARLNLAWILSIASMAHCCRGSLLPWLIAAVVHCHQWPIVTNGGSESGWSVATMVHD